MRDTRPQCQRCLVPRPAETVGHFSYENYAYEIDLCDMHARMFDTDLSNWVRLARDAGPVGAKEAVDNTVVPFPVVDAGVEYLDERQDFTGEEISLEALSYTFGNHAKFRMQKRGLSKTEIYQVISTKNKTIRPGRSGDTLVYMTKDVKVVVNPLLKLIVTVAYRHETLKDYEEEMQASGAQ